MLTVEEARERSVCRVCGQPITPPFGGTPKGWTSRFGAMTYPVRITLNFGEEFAHTACLEAITPPSLPPRSAGEEGTDAD